ADGVRETLGVRAREVALERRRLDRTDRDRGEHERCRRIRVAVRREGSPLRAPDVLHQLRDRGLLEREGALRGLGSTGLGRTAAFARRLAWRGLLRGGLLRRHAVTLAAAPSRPS